MKNFLRKALSITGYRVVRDLGAADPQLASLSAMERKILAAIEPYTMTSTARVLALLDAVKYVADNRLDGAFVECGVWRGGSSMAAALAFLACEGMTRDLYLYDTFAGMPAPGTLDRDWQDISAEEQLQKTARGTGVWCEASAQEVVQNMSSTGYDMDKVKIVSGLVEDTVPSQAPGRIALLRLDTDWYSSVLHTLKHLYGRVVGGGVIIIDDYGHWKGAKKAVDEFLAERNLRPLLHRIDYTGRLFLKEEES